MRKWWILGAILFFVVAAVIFAVTNLNSYLNENRVWLQQQAEAAIGRRVTFDEIGVSVLGGLGARLTNLRVADDPKFSTGDFVRAGRVRVLVRVIPALTGRYEIAHFVLERPEVVVIQDSHGFNFDTIGTAAEGGGQATPAGASTQPSGSSGAQALPFLIAAMRLEDGELSYVDRTSPAGSTKKPLVIRRLNVSASNVSLSAPVRVEMTAALFGGEKQNFALKGTVGPVGDTADISHIPLDLGVKVGPVVLNDLKRVAILTDAIPPALDAPDPLSASVDVKGTPERLAVTASFDATGASIAFGDQFVKQRRVPLSLELTAERTEQEIEIERLELRLAALELTVRGKLQPTDKTAVDLQVDIARTDLEGWDRVFPQLAGQQVSGSLEGRVHVAGTLGGGNLPRLTGSLDLRDVGVRVDGIPGGIRGFSSALELTGDGARLPATSFSVGGSPMEIGMTLVNLAEPVITFTLTSRDLRLSSLGAASPPRNDAEAIRGLAVQGKASMINGATSFRGSIRSSGGNVRGIDYKALHADIDFRDGVASMSNLSLELFDGTVAGKGLYDMRDAASPRFEAQTTVSGVQIGRLLAASLKGAEDKVQGALHAELTLAGAGSGWDTIRRRLRGHGSAELKDGAIKGVNVADAVLGSVTGVPGLAELIPGKVRKKYPELFTAQDTSFDALKGSVDVADGRVTTKDMTLGAKDYSIRGRGYFTLENEIDYTATLIASERLTNEVVGDVPVARRLASPQGRLRIPFRMTGALPHVRVKPDIDFIAKAVGGALIEEGVGKLLGTALGGVAKKKTGAKRAHGAGRRRVPEKDTVQLPFPRREKAATGRTVGTGKRRHEGNKGARQAKGGKPNKGRKNRAKKNKGQGDASGSSANPVDDLLEKGLRGIFGR